jgi:hypothetical protein
MIARYILPWFGRIPAVWSMVLLFSGFADRGILCLLVASLRKLHRSWLCEIYRDEIAVVLSR